jgi:hypothetical protein
VVDVLKVGNLAEVGKVAFPGCLQASEVLQVAQEQVRMLARGVQVARSEETAGVVVAENALQVLDGKEGKDVDEIVCDFFVCFDFLANGISEREAFNDMEASDLVWEDENSRHVAFCVVLVSLSVWEAVVFWSSGLPLIEVWQTFFFFFFFFLFFFVFFLFYR